MSRRYRALICGRCSLEFLIPKKHYNSNDTYYCPICRTDRIATEADLKPVKQFGQQKKVQPYIAEKED